ncbi:MAG: hypothetical protein ACRDF4_01280 [Rhabdochlamydiaceae bacterium]
MLLPEPEIQEVPKVSGFVNEPQERERHSLKPKTYLVESNAGLEKLHQNGYAIRPSEDRTLTNILCSNQFYLYLDTLDPRYWKIHSIYYADQSDNAIDSMVAHNPNQLDYFWLSSSSLEQIGKDKQGTGFGLSFSDYFSPNKDDKPSLSMRLWGGNTNSILKGLRTIPEIKGQISLTNISIDYLTDDGHSNENIYQNGKLTARSGDSIDSHYNLIEKVNVDYKNLIEEIESGYEFEYDYREFYCSIKGTYSVINFESDLRNLEKFAENLTSGNEPFRIWGLWKAISEKHIKIKGVDLHTNSPLELEILPREIRIFLRKGSCGNIVTRLITNIQTRFHSGSGLIGIDRADIITAH